MGNPKRLTVLDEKYRVSIGAELAKESGVRKGERLVAIPFRGGIILERGNSTKFTESLPGFRFEESKHEATKYVKSLVKDADT